MTDLTPFNMSFPAESVVFVVDEYSQYKKAMIDDYCYTHSPVVITDIHQLAGKLTLPNNQNLLLDCVLKWDDAREYNNVADVLRFHTTGLLMTMNKPAAFDPMIRAKVDYLVLFRGRNLRHLRRIHRQYLASFLDDPAILSTIFKSLGWGQGLVLDLAAMQATGRFSGNYYKYSTHSDINNNATDDKDNSFANLDVALGEWVASGIIITPDSDLTLSQEPINSDWEIITPIDYTLSRLAQPSSTPETTTQTPVIELTPETTTHIPEPIHVATQKLTSETEKLTQESTTLMPQEPQISNPEPSTPEKKPENTNEPQNQQEQQSWASYLYSKAWSLFG